MVPPCSDRIARVPPYSSTILRITRTGLSPTEARHSKRFRLSLNRHWPGPRSLATTSGVSVDVLSSGYLDVSVRRVCLLNLCIQFRITLRWGFPIRKSTDQSLLAAPRSLSQRATSFIASQCQGIHEMPLRRLIASYAGENPTHDTQLPTTQLSATDVFQKLYCVRSEKPIHNDKEHDAEPKFPSAQSGPDDPTTMEVPLSNEMLDPLLDSQTKVWWSRTGSNRRPEACKATALPTELRPLGWFRLNC